VIYGCTVFIAVQFFYTGSKYLLEIIGMKDVKQRLFEVMEVVNPDFKQLAEVVPQQQGTVATDIARQQKALNTSPAMQYANSKIDTPQEFEDGFKTWLSTTGFNPKTRPLSISQAQTLIRNAMVALGYK